jgi:hypothetical protein
MKVEIIHSENPYVMDYVAERLKMPALTRKNADFIEAVVRLDSNYAKDFEIHEPSENYDPEENAESSHGKYCGSTAYWFSELMKTNCNFRKCILGAVIAIDRTNTTHLEASYDGRKTMRNIICDYCNDYHDLVRMLEVPFKRDKHNHLISLLNQKTIAKKDDGARYNISFATKFCTYAAIFLDSQIRYSKYDNIVSDALPTYSKVYLGESKNAREYKINEYQRRNLDDNGNFQYRLDVYGKYESAISRILNELRADGIYLTREEFDHIVWYGLK